MYALARRGADQLERLLKLLGRWCVWWQLLLHGVAALLRLIIGFSGQNHLVRHLAITSILLNNSFTQAARDRDSLLREALLGLSAFEAISHRLLAR